MADVSQAPQRVTQQKRPGAFRGGFLAEADARLAPAKVASDMRNAYRPDSADDVRRALGMVNDTAEKFVQLDSARREVADRADAATAVQDEALGRVEEEALPSRSTAYRAAISWSRVRRRAAETEVAVIPEVEALLARGANADPTRGEEVIDLEDVNKLLDDRFRALLVGPDGRPVDFGDPSANTFLYDKLNDVRMRVNSRAAEIIQQQEQQKVLLGLSDEVELDAKDGGLEVEPYISRAAALGIDPGTAKEAFRAAAINGARAAENPEVLLTLADSRRPDGTPSWNPAEENQLREAYATLHARVEADRDREALERSQATVGRLEIEVREGRRLNTTQVRELVARGELRPEDADTAFAIQDRYDDNAYQQLQRQRANISWQQSQADRARSLSRDRRGEAEDSAARSLRIRILSGDLSGAAATRSVRQAFASGALSVSAYDRLLQEARQVPQDGNIAERRGARTEEGSLHRTIRQGYGLAGTPGHVSRSQWSGKADASLETFYTRLRQGETPSRALADAYSEMGVSTPVIGRAVRANRAQALSEAGNEDDGLQ